jgi:hypothetical protein
MGPALIGIVIAAVAGVMAGSANQRGRRARLDYKRTRSLIPAARKLAWAESVRSLKVIVVATAAVMALSWVMHLLGRA